MGNKKLFFTCGNVTETNFLKKKFKKRHFKIFFYFKKKKNLHYVFEENWRPIPVANNGQHLPTVLSCPEDEFCLGNCRKSGFSCFSNTEGLMAQCSPWAENYLKNWFKIIS